jgi:two-component system, cell cycle sensor histidine kinase and response regulator CckA
VNRAWREGAWAVLGALAEPAALLGGDGAVRAMNPACRQLLGPALAASGAAASWFQAAQRGEFTAALAAGDGRLLLFLADPIATPRQVEARLALVAPDLLLLRLVPPAPPPREERLALVGRMAGGVAHDFNNLLGIVTGTVEALRRPGTAAAPELAVLESVAGRGAELVRQLLAFARQQRLAPVVLALNDRVAETGALLPRLIGSAVRLEVALEQPGRLVLADPSQLDQVIINLVVNARDALQRAGRPGTVRLATGHRLVLRAGGEGPGAIPPGRYATLVVEDDGPGIPPEILPRIFEPFFTTRIDQGGTGLGLATVQGIVAQSGGHITAECPASGGTRFTILLPRHEGVLPVAVAPQVAAGARPGTILLVEDEPALLRLGAGALRAAGHQVLVAEDGYAALEMLEAGAAPGLLVSDVSMPGMDGVALARAVRALRPGLPVLLLSGYAASALAVNLPAEGWHFLAKPFTGEALCAGAGAALASGAE